MKIVAIGDIHGKDVWKKIVEKEKDADEFVFIGDYFDSWDHSFDKQWNNMLDIIAFKQEFPHKVTLLLGNHDYHYIQEGETYSGYQPKHAKEIGELVQACVDHDQIQMAHQSGKFLFTHAGVTETWAKEWGVQHYNKPARDMIFMLKNQKEAFKFTPNDPTDNTGESITQPPIWVRPDALMKDAMEEVIHVVGHTKHKEITFRNDEGKLYCIFIDVLDYQDQYLVINDGVPSVATL